MLYREAFAPRVLRLKVGVIFNCLTKFNCKKIQLTCFVLGIG